jgi:4-aminobutyrate aminotransferase-like enzyme/Ser/Thr protein kinase RdoA (MazF antagonist)
MPHEVRTVLEERAPSVSASSAVRLVHEHFPAFAGVHAIARVDELPSERDRNLMLRLEGGEAAVLKISNAAEDPAVVAMENAAMDHVAATDPTLPVPRLIRSRSAEVSAPVVGDDGQRHLARLVTALPGRHLEGRAVSSTLAHEIGRADARMSVALRGLFDPAGARVLAWDIRQLPRSAEHAHYVQDPALRELVLQVCARVQPALDATRRMRSGLQHADLTLTNVLTDASGRLSALIDFGDMHHTAVVCDMVASMTSVLRSAAGATTDDLVALAASFLEGYQRVQPLEVDEAEVLGDLVLARLATTVLISAWRIGRHPENAAYITQYDASSWTLLRQLTSVDAARLTARFTRLAGTSRVRPGGRSGADSGDALLARRNAVLGGRLAPLTYRRPVEIVRGQGPWLFGADGRRYLDGYNNVPVVGHAHPTVTQAISRQSALLNTHSRYLHANIVELAERIVATMPPGLDTCVFANSGTEANDLAWRMATMATGGDGALIAQWAYHGISAAVVDFSSNEWPRGHHPGHVGTFRAPHRGPAEPGPGHGDAVARIAAATGWLEERGHRPALLLVDSMFTSEGILQASPEFMAGLVDATRASGALFLADEVQAGFGRCGPALWRFASLGITPDFVTLGKPMGSGHPVSALVTRRAIAEEFSSRYEFFSTFAGNPVSCAAALAVLDVLEDQQLPDRALAVGEHLRSGLRSLAATYPVIADVRGYGLIAGVELRGTGAVTGRDVAAGVVEGLRDRGCLVGATGPAGNVLKIRPPLVWTDEHADLLVSTLDEVLSRPLA